MDEDGRHRLKRGIEILTGVVLDDRLTDNHQANAGPFFGGISGVLFALQQDRRDRRHEQSLDVTRTLLFLGFRPSDLLSCQDL